MKRFVKCKNYGEAARQFPNATSYIRTNDGYLIFDNNNDLAAWLEEPSRFANTILKKESANNVIS